MIDRAAGLIPSQDQPAEVAEWFNLYPIPVSPPLRPLHALISVFRLIRNKEDTRQVFEVVSSLAGKSGRRLFKRFVSTPYGRRVAEKNVKLENILDDWDALRELPDGSVGRAYLHFMESEGLTAGGLISAANEAGIDFEGETDFEAFHQMFLHIDISHDLWHVLTGYGRDALGEACVLAFTRTQTRNPGFRLIIFVGALAFKTEHVMQPFWRAIDEGVRMGKGAEWVLGYDVEDLLKLPLDEARRKLKINEPRVYHSIPDDVKKTLLKPRINKTQAQRDHARELAT